MVTTRLRMTPVLSRSQVSGKADKIFQQRDLSSFHDMHWGVYVKLSPTLSLDKYEKNNIPVQQLEIGLRCIDLFFHGTWIYTGSQIYVF